MTVGPTHWKSNMSHAMRKDTRVQMITWIMQQELWAFKKTWSIESDCECDQLQNGVRKNRVCIIVDKRIKFSSHGSYSLSRDPSISLSLTLSHDVEISQMAFLSRKTWNQIEERTRIRSELQGCEVLILVAVIKKRHWKKEAIWNCKNSTSLLRVRFERGETLSL